jgi:DNA-binding GntR family transcriptional regulator
MTEQRAALVTGARGGIGAAIVARLEADGWAVHAVTRLLEPSEVADVVAFLLGARRDSRDLTCGGLVVGSERPVRRAAGAQGDRGRRRPLRAAEGLPHRLDVRSAGMSLESTKADDIAVVIEESILSGELAPGAVLRQEQLSERFGVSRTPVREALRRLAALGLVSFEPNKGVRVRTLSHGDLREAFLVRAELEALVTEIAARKWTSEAMAELEECEKRFARLTKEVRSHEPGGERRSLMADWMRANHAFHDVIYRLANVPFIESVAKSARRTMSGPTVWAPVDDELERLYERNQAEHRAIRQALAAGSVAGARVLAHEHVMHSFQLLTTILDHVSTDWARS